jgi:glyoxylase-like metal-dependent hydrolase (beta-lactamase superfamily II)
MVNEIFRFKVGHFTCLILQDRPASDQLVSPRNVLLIQTGNQQVLIDPGLGCDLIPGSPYPGMLRDRLPEAGISPADIDLVLFSHADLDHIGGAVDESGSAAFPHAHHLLLRDEFAFWSSKPERLRLSETCDETLRQVCQNIPPARLKQLHDKLEVADTESEIVPGIRFTAASGHTPGHSAIAIASGDDRLLFIGDLIYEPKDCEDSEWYSIFDFDPGQAIATRQRIFAKAASERTLLLAYHLPFPGLGYVTQQERGWRWSRMNN